MNRIAWLGSIVWLSLLLSGAAQAASSSHSGQCAVQCDQALAKCEHQRGPAGNCARRLSNCQSDCEHGKPKDKRSKKQRRQAACEQRCDMNRSACEQSNPHEPQHCVAGQQSCIQRCR